jgi:hypothetical protein
MQNIIIMLYCLMLTTTAALAEDLHLVQTIAVGDRLLPADARATNSIYVLLLPLHEGGKVHINPVVLKKFDGKEIGGIIAGAVSRGFLPSGSVLHVDPSPRMDSPPDAEVRILTDYCKQAGITLLVSMSE